MRKSKLILTEVDELVYLGVTAGAENLFSFLPELGLSVPEWAEAGMVSSRDDRRTIAVRFFEDPKEMVVSYTRACMRKGETWLVRCVQKDDVTAGWRKLTPPTLIGSKLPTRLRGE